MGGKGSLAREGKRGGYLIEGGEEGVVFLVRGEKQGGLFQGICFCKIKIC